ncbi:MAG: glycosyltransferase [Campylobacteraceae bacterium]|jgi:glycosyltransferase involved in cell wall biosynthesis|nr:glycosyltransferase [Campylobacteraceae bacterium]
MNNPKISIVLPTYNGERYLAASICSVVEQSERSWELIIVDDASTDKSLIIANSFAKHDNRIRVVSNSVNKQLPASLNIGFANAKGKYFTWTSDDNLYEKNALAVMVEYLDRHGCTDLVSFGMDHIDENGKKIVEYVPIVKRHILELAYRCNIGAAFMYRASSAKRVGKYDEQMFCAEDYEYWIRIALNGKIDYVDDMKLYSYRIHKHNLTATKKREVHEKTFLIQEKYLYEFIKKFELGYLECAILIFLTHLKKSNKEFMRYWSIFFVLWIYKKLIKTTAMFIPQKKWRHVFREQRAIRIKEIKR